jgi:hypothetical protein
VTGTRDRKGSGDAAVTARGTGGLSSSGSVGNEEHRSGGGQGPRGDAGRVRLPGKHGLLTEGVKMSANRVVMPARAVRSGTALTVPRQTPDKVFTSTAAGRTGRALRRVG